MSRLWGIGPQTPVQMSGRCESGVTMEIHWLYIGVTKSRICLIAFRVYLPPSNLDLFMSPQFSLDARISPQEGTPIVSLRKAGGRDGGEESVAGS